MTPPAPSAASPDILIRRRAALNIRNASGSSTTSAETMLTQRSLLRRSRMTSNHASQQSRVPVISRKAITIWRPRQKAQPVSAKPVSSTMSKPTQASRQCVARKSRCKVSTRTTIQATSTTQATAANRAASRERRRRFKSSSGWG
ncbi:MAG TPA: hypothetical protein VH372_05820 [Actinospica sp.]|nr:hypothetical protein [Actinospica sp.]